MRLVKQPDGSWVDLDPKLPEWKPNRSMIGFQKDSAGEAAARKVLAAAADAINRQWQADFRLQRPELRKRDGRRLPIAAQSLGGNQIP